MTACNSPHFDIYIANNLRFPANLAWCTLASPCVPSPWLCLQTAYVKGHDRRPEGSHWSYRISEWVRGRVPRPGQSRRRCNGAPDPCLFHSLSPGLSGSWTASRKAAAPSLFPCCLHAGYPTPSPLPPELSWDTHHWIISPYFTLLKPQPPSFLSSGSDSCPEAEFRVVVFFCFFFLSSIRPLHFLTSEALSVTSSVHPLAPPVKERWGREARSSDNTNPSASSSKAHAYPLLTAPPQKLAPHLWNFTHELLHAPDTAYKYFHLHSVYLKKSNAVLQKHTFFFFHIKHCFFGITFPKLKWKWSRMITRHMLNDPTANAFLINISRMFEQSSFNVQKGNGNTGNDKGLLKINAICKYIFSLPSCDS